MTHHLLEFQNSRVLVIGAGIMGAGIAHVAAQAGHRVWLHDARNGAAVEAKVQLATTLDGLVKKGRLSAEAALATIERIEPLDRLAEAADAGLAIEAIVERLDSKRALLAELEGLLAPTAILATNTSSISVTALAKELQHPGRLVGMHFFNPVPLMRLVEVVSGLHTVPAVAEAIYALSVRWGKVPVHARSTPGFIVNRIARPYYAETLALLQERAASAEVLDACLKTVGFRMGPCELMDLIGHDTNFAVTSSVYEANFYDKRFQPSLVQRELVDGGLLGRKSGRGFYRYPEGRPALPTEPYKTPAQEPLIVHGRDALADALAQKLAELGYTHDRVSTSTWTGLAVGDASLIATDGRTANEMAGALGNANVAVFDRFKGTGPLAYAVADGASAAWQLEAAAWLAALGHEPQRVADVPGLIVARTLAMLINEAADAVAQGVCSESGADAAMKLGVNYPAGPFEWLADWSSVAVVKLLDALDRHYRGERYRASPWLRRRAAVGLA